VINENRPGLVASACLFVCVVFAARPIRIAPVAQHPTSKRDAKKS